MYTWVKARVKVLLLLSVALKSFYGKVFVAPAGSTVDRRHIRAARHYINSCRV